MQPQADSGVNGVRDRTRAKRALLMGLGSVVGGTGLQWAGHQLAVPLLAWVGFIIGITGVVFLGGAGYLYMDGLSRALSSRIRDRRE